MVSYQGLDGSKLKLEPFVVLASIDIIVSVKSILTEMTMSIESMVYNLAYTQILQTTTTKMSVRIHQKCPREFTYYVHENSPFMATRSLPPFKSP